MPLVDDALSSGRKLISLPDTGNQMTPVVFHARAKLFKKKKEKKRKRSTAT